MKCLAITFLVLAALACAFYAAETMEIVIPLTLPSDWQSHQWRLFGCTNLQHPQWTVLISNVNMSEIVITNPPGFTTQGFFKFEEID